MPDPRLNTFLGKLFRPKSNSEALPIAQNDSSDDESITQSLQQTVAKIETCQLEPHNLWRAAYSRLDPSEQAQFTCVLQTQGSSLQDILQNLADSAKEKSTEGSETRQFANRVLGAALSTEKLVTALTACDPTGHAACAWSVVFLGLTMVRKHESQKLEILESSTMLSEILYRYSFFEIYFYFQETETEVNEGLRQAIIQVYTAILRYVVAVMEIKGKSVTRAIMRDITGTAVERLKDLKSTVENADTNFEKWTQVASLFIQKKYTEKILEEVHLQGAKADARAAKEEWENFLDWIYRFPIYERLDDLILKRHKKEEIGSGFLNSEELSLWKQGRIQTLHCHGPPSAGKTMLMTATIEYFNKDFPKIPLAFIYCDYKSKDQQNYFLLISLILRQLLEACPIYHSLLLPEYRKNPKRVSRIERLLEDLEALIISQERILIILDALDELQADVRNELLTELCRLSKNCQTLQLLTTSRSNTIKFPSNSEFESFSIKPTDLDILSYVKNSITNDIVLRDEDLQEQVILQISKAANGISMSYMVPKVQIGIINQQLTGRKQVEKCLKNLPTQDESLDSTYKDAMKRIADNETSRIDAHKLLTLLVQAKRPLRGQEILTALTTDEFDTTPTSKEEVSVSSDISFTTLDLKDAIALCMGLVDYDEISDVVRLAHETIFSFLKCHQNVLDTVSGEYVPLVCIAYLNKCDSVGYDRSAISTPRSLMEGNHFLDYAARYLTSHVNDVGTENINLQTQLKRFLEKESAKVSDPYFIMLYQENAASEALKYWKGKEVDTGFYDWAHGDENSMKLNSVQRMVLLGFPSMLDRFLEQSSHSVDTFDTGDLPLNYAARTGRLDEAKVLVRHGADLNAIGRTKRAPLHVACRYASLEMIEWLVYEGADVNIRSEADNGETPLHIATFHDRNDVVDFLISRGGLINIGLTDNPRYTPLRNALDHGRERCRKLLLFEKRCFTLENAAGLDIPMESNIVRELIENYVPPDATFGQGHGSLDVGLLQRDRELIDLCLKKNVKPKLYWPLDSEEITFQKQEPFYEDLVESIKEAKQPIIWKQRVDEQVFTWYEDTDPYLEIQIPKGAPKLTKVIFTIVSHDQGWSNFEYDKGAYSSLTWFEARLEDSSTVSTADYHKMHHPITCRNKHAISEWNKQIVSWDRSDVSPEIRNWFKGLVPGRMIQVFPRVTGEIEWKNFVKSVRMEIFA